MRFFAGSKLKFDPKIRKICYLINLFGKVTKEQQAV